MTRRLPSTPLARAPRLALAVLLPLALLVGCADDPVTPQPLDRPATTPDPSLEHTPAPRAETPEEFIRRWVRAQNKMQVTGMTKPYRALTTGCDACDRIAQRVEEIYMSGGLIRTSGWTITQFGRREKIGDRAITLDFTVNSDETAFRERTKSPLRRFSGGTGLRKRVHLERSHGGWKIAYLAELPS